MTIRIAIVDDHEIVREGLKSILQGEPDFEVVAESDTAEGLSELVEKAKPDVVLLDARLPGISGAEACRGLVEAHPDTAVLMVSTYSDDQLVEECIRAGARGYVIKDIERFSLKESIRAVDARSGRRITGYNREDPRAVAYQGGITLGRVVYAAERDTARDPASHRGRLFQ